MSMKNPPHPGRSIAEDLDALGVSTAEAAEHMGVTRQQLHRVVTGVSAISPEMAVRLEKAVGGTAEAWLAMQRNYDLAQARRVPMKVRKIAPKAA